MPQRLFTYAVNSSVASRSRTVARKSNLGTLSWFYNFSALIVFLRESSNESVWPLMTVALLLLLLLNTFVLLFMMSSRFGMMTIEGDVDASSVTLAVALQSSRSGVIRIDFFKGFMMIFGFSTMLFRRSLRS